MEFSETKLGGNEKIVSHTLLHTYIFRLYSYKQKFYSFGQTMSNLNSIFKYVTRRLNTQYELDEVICFFFPHMKLTKSNPLLIFS